MFKKFFVLFLIGILTFTATGCSLLGNDDDDDVASTTVVKTVIKKPTSVSGNILGDLRAGVRAQVTTDVVTGAVVTLTLADGRVITMTDNGNGEYTATVSNLAGATGFIIEARKGDLLVQNMVTDLGNTDLANIETNHLTTAFAQVAMSAAKVLSTSTGIQVATLDDLIKNVTSISIDYSELKRQVTDETNVLYESSRNIVTVALSGADEAKESVETGSSLLEKIISGSFAGVDAGVLTDLSDATGLVITTETTTNVWEDKVTTPMTDYIPTEAPEADEVAIKAAATTFTNAFMKLVSGSALTSEEQTNLSAVLTEDFVMNGKTKSVLLNSQPSDKDDLDHFDGGHSLIKVDDNTYLIHVAGTAYLKTGGSVTLDSTVEGFAFTGTNPTEFRSRFLESNISEFPVIIARQSDGSWKVSGNRIKIDEEEIQLNYTLDLTQTAPRQYTNFWLQLEDTTAFPIDSVIVSGGEIGATGVALSKDATIADSNTWHYWHTDSYIDVNQNTVTNTYTSSYPWSSWTYSATQHQAGQEYKFTVKFKDGSTQTFFHQVPEIPAGYAPFSATSVSATVADNKVKIVWPKNANPSLFDGYYISVWDHSTGDGRILENSIDDINTTSAEFALTSTSYQLVSGKQYTVNFDSHLKTGLSQHFQQNFTVP